MFLKVLTFFAIKENASTTHTGQMSEPAGCCAEAELSSDNLHTLIFQLHIWRTGGNLIRLVVVHEHSSILLLSFRVISKLCVRQAL